MVKELQHKARTAVPPSRTRRTRFRANLRNFTLNPYTPRNNLTAVFTSELRQLRKAWRRGQVHGYRVVHYLVGHGQVVLLRCSRSQLYRNKSLVSSLKSGTISIGPTHTAHQMSGSCLEQVRQSLRQHQQIALGYEGPSPPESHMQSAVAVDFPSRFKNLTTSSQSSPDIAAQTM